MDACAISCTQVRRARDVSDTYNTVPPTRGGRWHTTACPRGLPLLRGMGMHVLGPSAQTTRDAQPGTHARLRCPTPRMRTRSMSRRTHMMPRDVSDTCAISLRMYMTWQERTCWAPAHVSCGAYTQCLGTYQTRAPPRCPYTWRSGSARAGRRHTCLTKRDADKTYAPSGTRLASGTQRPRRLRQARSTCLRP